MELLKELWPGLYWKKPINICFITSKHYQLFDMDAKLGFLF